MVAKKISVPKHAAHITTPRTIQIAMIFAVIGGFFLIRPYIGTVLFSMLIAYLFSPVYRKVLSWTKRKGVALTATLLTALLTVVIPLSFVAGVTVIQAEAIVKDLRSSGLSFKSADIQSFSDKSIDKANELLRGIPGGENVQLSKTAAVSQAKKIATSVANGIINFLRSSGSALFGFITNTILAFFLISALLVHQDKLKRNIRRISPFDDTINNLYIQRAGAMTKAMAKGQVVIAIVQGILAGMSLWIAGLDYITFFVVLLIFLSFIPLGAGIVTMPIGVILIATGQVWQGIFVILFHIFVVSFIDNLLRPRLVPKSAAMNTAVLLLAVFSGLAIFGAVGAILGPVVMILILTTFFVYGEYSSKAKKTALPAAQ